MAKIAAWLILLIGVLLILPALTVAVPAWVGTWIIPLLVIIIGIVKLTVKYK